MIYVLFVFEVACFGLFGFMLYKIGYIKGYNTARSEMSEIYKRSLKELKETNEAIRLRIEEMQHDNDRAVGIIQEAEDRR